MTRYLVAGGTALLLVAACGQPLAVSNQGQSGHATAAPTAAAAAAAAPAPAPSYGPQARRLHDRQVVVEPVLATDRATVTRSRAAEIAKGVNWGRGEPNWTLGRVTVEDYGAVDSQDRLLSRVIDKRLAWVVEYPMEPGHVEEWLITDPDPTYVPPTKIAPSQSIILIDALNGKVLMMSSGG